VTLSGSDIVETHPDANEGGGVGIYASDRTAPVTLTLDATTIEDQPYATIWLEGDGAFAITDSTLVGGYGLEVTMPNGSTSTFNGDGVVALDGVTAWDGATGLLLEGNTIRDAYRAGVLLDSSSAALSSNSFFGNGLDLIWQHCDGVSEPTRIGAVPVVDSCPVYNHSVAPLEFNLFLEEATPTGKARSGDQTERCSGEQLHAW
jgi:Right handed beta helix region